MTSLIERLCRRFLLLWVTLALVASMVTLVPMAQAAPFAAVVTDARSGETLYDKNADARLHPASLTKMMTLYIVFEELQRGRLTLDTKVTISKHAASQPPSRLGLKPGQRIAVRYLIRAAAVKSANDAATALGEAVSGNEADFAKRMTRTAKALGMRNSTFKNANGLTAPGHLSSARDMNTLGRRLFYDFPQYYNIFSRRQADAGLTTVRNTNSRFLDSYKGADGIKTGYTSAAGFNLTASAERGNKRVIATIFGGTSTAQRNAKMAELMDIGFGKAPSNSRVIKPDAPAYSEDTPIAALEPADDQVVPGASAKTIRISGAVQTSLRPKARPGAEAVPTEVAVALTEGIEGALAEATAPPPPSGTLEAQVLALTDVPQAQPGVDAAPAGTVIGADIAALAAIPPAGTEIAAVQTELAAADVVDPIPAPPARPLRDAATATAIVEDGTLEAQAVALADGSLPTADAALPTPGDDAQPVTEVALVLAASPMPRARPERLLADAPSVAADADVLVADAATEATVPATVATDAEVSTEVTIATSNAAPLGLDEAELVSLAMADDLAKDLAPAEAVAQIESVSSTGILPVALAAMTTPRRAPIFEAAALSPKPAEADGEIVVAVSTSGGSNWGVSVDGYTSHAEAEKAMFRLALAENATLNVGHHKVQERSGSYSARFLGLSEEQANLACRRLAARAVPCETVSPQG